MYNPITKFIDYLRYREAVKKAEKAHKQTGERYYVMPATGTDKPTLIIMNRDNFRKLRKKHYINHNAKVRDLLNECFYCTAYSNGNGFLDAKGRKMKLSLYFSYCQAIRKKRKIQYGK